MRNVTKVNLIFLQDVLYGHSSQSLQYLQPPFVYRSG